MIFSLSWRLELTIQSTKSEVSMVSFVIREPTNIEAENFWENSSQQDVTESRYFPPALFNV